MTNMLWFSTVLGLALVGGARTTSVAGVGAEAPVLLAGPGPAGAPAMHGVAGAPGRQDGSDRFVELAGLQSVLLLPPGFDPSLPRSVLLALPPGGQDESMVERGLELYFEEEGLSRGWVIVSPAAPAGSDLTERADLLQPLIDALAEQLTIEGGRVHVAGVSNGGRSAVRYAVEYPERVASLTLLPGATSSQSDRERLSRIAHLPIAMHVGAQDQGWVEAGRSMLARFEELGAKRVSLTLHEGQGHVLAPEVGRRAFEDLEPIRAEMRALDEARARVSGRLDQLFTTVGEGFEACIAQGAHLRWPGSGERPSAARFQAWIQDALVPARLEERVIRVETGLEGAHFEERRREADGRLLIATGLVRRVDGEWRVTRVVWAREASEKPDPAHE